MICLYYLGADDSSCLTLPPETKKTEIQDFLFCEKGPLAFFYTCMAILLSQSKESKYFMSIETCRRYLKDENLNDNQVQQIRDFLMQLINIFYNEVLYVKSI